MWVPSKRSSVPIISASWLNSFCAAIEDSTNTWLTTESMSFLFQNNFQKEEPQPSKMPPSKLNHLKLLCCIPLPFQRITPLHWQRGLPWVGALANYFFLFNHWRDDVLAVPMMASRTVIFSKSLVLFSTIELAVHSSSWQYRVGCLDVQSN